MKKILLITVFAFFALYSFSQNEKSSIGVNKQYGTADTTSTFALMQMSNFDNNIERLIKFWGTPQLNETGQIRWAHIDIPNVGEDLNVTLTDRICTAGEVDIVCIPFKDKEDKEIKMRDLKSNQYRDIEITITNQEGKNIINSKEKTETVKTLLKSNVE